MAYTSPSNISSSQWFGPGSSPIISPSRWQTQVLDNLCILSLHDHSGSAGEGACTLSTSLISIGGMREFISPFFPSACDGNWSVEIDTTWPGMGRVSTSTNGACITFDTYFNPGTHGVQFFYGKGSSFGIITACLSGGSTISSPSSIDTYSTGAESPPTGSGALDNQLGTFNFRIYTTQEFNASGSVVTGSLVGGGRYQLMFKISGSGASSTGYITRIGYMYLE